MLNKKEVKNKSKKLWNIIYLKIFLGVLSVLVILMFLLFRLEELINFITYHSYYMGLIIVFGLCSSFLTTRFRWQNEKNEKRVAYTIFGLSFCLYMFFYMLKSDYGYGAALYFEKAIIHENLLLAMDESGTITKGRRTGYRRNVNWRLHSIDLNTGEKVFRASYDKSPIRIIGFSKTLFVIETRKRKEDFMLNTLKADFIGYNRVSGKVEFKVNTEIIEQKHSHLTNSIKALSFDCDKGLFSIVTKQGINYFFNPITFSLMTSDEENSFVGETYHINNNEQMYGREDNTNAEFLLESSTEKARDPGETAEKIDGFSLSNGIRKQVLDSAGNVLNKSDIFIDGGLLESFKQDKILTLISYASTDHKLFFLTGMSYDGKLVWQIKETEELGIHGKFSFSFKYNKKLILLIGGSVLAVDIKTGVIDWKLEG